MPWQHLEATRWGQRSRPAYVSLREFGVYSECNRKPHIADFSFLMASVHLYPV